MDETMYDLCIVGAGFFGSAAAKYASGNPHLKIILIGLDEPALEKNGIFASHYELEKRDIFSSHYDEGRIVKTLFPSPTFQKLSRISIGRLRVLEKISGINFYNPVGFMNIGKRGNRVMKNLEDISGAVKTPLMDIFHKQLLNKMYPFLCYKDDEYGLLDNTGAGIISARKMIQAERKVARELGCHILFDSVTDVDPLRDNYHLVETANHGKIKSKRVLFTTGAFTNVNKFKILPQLEMYVYKEMAALVRVPYSEAERLSSMTGIIYQRDEKDTGYYILPPVMYPDGRYYLKIGSMMYDSGEGMQTAEEIKEWFLSKEVDGETASLSKFLFEILPGLTTDGIVRKICVTCETPTGFPYIDQVTPTVTLAVAANAWGATTAEEIGRLAVCLSLTGAWDSELQKSLFEIVPKQK